MSRFFGIDTSNYRTSAALFDSETMQWKNSGRLLEVPEGRIGLRQSDALFQHVLHLPARIDALEAGFGKNLRAIAASTRPRAVEGSYMPCFLAGAGQARSMAHALDVPFYEVSHQQGHLAAAALSANALDLLRQPFLAWHLSGGTTELLHVKPEGKLFSAEIIGGTDDLAAGQLIDRAGNLLHLPFPSGAQLEQLANQCEEPEKPFRPKVMDFHFSLSGAQNKIEQLHQKGADAPTGQPQQRNDNKGGHRHRLNGQNIGPQQGLHPGKPGGQGRQNQGRQKCQEKTQADAAKGEAQSLPGGLFSQQRDHTPGHLNRPHQQQPVVDQHRRQLPNAKGQKGSKKLCCPSGWIDFRFTRHNRKRHPAERRPLRQGSARTAHSGSRPEHPSSRCR